MKIYVIALVPCFDVLASCGKEKEVTSSRPYPTVKDEVLKGVARTRFDSPDPTPAQLDRRAKNAKSVKDMGLPVLETLPVVEDEKTVQIRTSEEVAKRCVAVTICAVKGEVNEQPLTDELIQRYSAAAYFTPKEKLFVGSAHPSRQELLNFSWQYECVHVLLWALGARETLSPPNTICPVSEDVKMFKKSEPLKFVSDAKLRPATDILDMADLYYRLHWAAIELRIKGTPSDKLDEGVIRERHKALNWLIRYLNQEWDHVSTDT